MTYEKIDKAAWPTFCDRVSQLLEGRPVEIDVIGLEIGNQIEAERLALSGITYDAADDAINVYLQVGSTRDSPQPGHFEHAIRAPRELYAEVGDAGISQVIVLDAEGNKQFVTLQEYLKLPASGTHAPS